ncbi:TadE/TadG family type IV pilus assembly protein [[Clostridium] polysaccharolyticum]|uniref:TadE-like protein n=1 Tax=[Clostridium] polysaccharolyticum TaxID=29364 RepID=A0A1I0D9C4_9FIRM|nr:hypothetical protein [[Clostridium] polysaccharolyticum]SET28857.1 hypothetical protein SAMN04487772_11369 [[Clostridium] polysaccharolyticum]
MRKDNKGSFTVEASLAVPVFVLAITVFLLIFKSLFIQIILQDALTEAGKEVSQMAYMETSLNNKGLSEEGTSSIVLKREIQKFFQQSKSLDSLISGSVNYQESSYNKEQGIIELVATYKIKMPFSIFRLDEICFIQRVKTNAFIGKRSLLGAYEKKTGENAKDEYVYITETGTVYHKKFIKTAHY